MGKKGGGSSTTVQSYQPTSEEKKLWALQGQYEDAIMPNALDLNSKARNLLEKSVGDTQIDYDGLMKQALNKNKQAYSGYQSLAEGKLPSSYEDNIQNAVKRSVNSSMGNLLQDLGSKGVLNSSVASQGIQGINQAAANTAADMYNQDISQLAGLYGNMANMAGSDISTAAAAQEAAQQPAINLWNASTGLDSTNLGAISAMGNKGTTTQTTQMPRTSSMWGGILGGLASNPNLFCFSGDTKITTPDGWEYIKNIYPGDTIVTPEGEEKVQDILTPRYEMVYVICTADETDNTLFMTKTQPIMMEDGKYKTIEQMHFGDKPKGKGNIKVITESGDRLVYDLKVPSGSYYANGFIAKAATMEW